MEVTPWARASAMATSRARRRSSCEDGGIFERMRSEGGGFADDAGGFAFGVVVDLAAGRVGGGGGDAGGGEGCGVDYGDVLVGAGEDGGMAGGDGVDVGARGELLVGPDGVVPASAADPCSGGEGDGEGADAGLHLGEGGDVVEV